jgi:cobalt-zinc-cadmium efflux system protein
MRHEGRDHDSDPHPGHARPGHAHPGRGHGAHDHGGAARRAGARHAPRLIVAFLLVTAFLLVQVVTGLVTGSLALLSDAGHMATDAVGLGIAVAAIRLASKRSDDPRRTFGWYRLEILAALVNAILLVFVAGWVLIEAARRIGDPPHVDGPVVLVVGVIGLVVNVVCFLLLRAGADESLNVQGAYLEVLADLVGSVAVVIGAGVIWATGWAWVDPLLGALIGLWILPRALRLGREALRIITQAAPSDRDPTAIGADLASIDGVLDVHDLHVWTLTSGMDVVTAHVRIGVGVDAHSVLDQARDLLAERHRLEHATLQVEPDDHAGCDRVAW